MEAGVCRLLPLPPGGEEGTQPQPPEIFMSDGEPLPDDAWNQTAKRFFKHKISPFNAAQALTEVASIYILNLK